MIGAATRGPMALLPYDGPLLGANFRSNCLRCCVRPNTSLDLVMPAASSNFGFTLAQSGAFAKSRRPVLPCYATSAGNSLASQPATAHAVASFLQTELARMFTSGVGSPRVCSITNFASWHNGMGPAVPFSCKFQFAVAWLMFQSAWCYTVEM